MSFDAATKGTAGPVFIAGFPLVACSRLPIGTCGRGGKNEVAHRSPMQSPTAGNAD